MSKVSIDVNKKLAERNFLAKKYDKAMFYYSLALQESPNDKELKIGVLLCDMAGELDMEAQTLYDYYMVTKKHNSNIADELLEKLITSIDDTLSLTSQIISTPLLQRLEYENAISYEDFTLIVKQKLDFRLAFEDIMFSTKVIITEKNDLISFIESLIDNGFDEMAVSYLEGANSIFPSSSRIRNLFDKIEKKKS